MSARVIPFPTERAARAESVAQRVARLRLSSSEASMVLAMVAAIAPELVGRELDWIEGIRARLAMLPPAPQVPQA